MFGLDASTILEANGKQTPPLVNVHLLLYYFYNFTPLVPCNFCGAFRRLTESFKFLVLKDISTFYKVVDDCIKTHSCGQNFQKHTTVSYIYFKAI